ncbi:MAG: helix-hairpin-helix domain-containing protein, partial [Desulfobacterales bacterium]
QRGEKRRLIAMATENADKQLQDRMASTAAREDMLRRLGRALKIDKTPWRIECFDNSTLGGTEPVSGMVVFEKGNPLKSDYRKYKLKPLPEPDDYAYMAEVLERRYRPGDETMPQPDLLVVDGGKGQLNIALSVVRELGMEGAFAIIGIAKKDESRGETEDKIYTPGRSNPIAFGRAGDLLLFLQRVRDEAHRFAISFHRQRRGKTSLQSALDGIPGIGEKRKAALLKHFGGIRKIRAAAIDDLAAVSGINPELAETLKRHLSD